MGVLKVNTIQLENGNAPTAADLGFAAGSILQVVQETHTTQTELTTTGTWTDVSSSATITPTSANSKILVIHSAGGMGNASTATSVGMRILRGTTNIASRARQAYLTEQSPTKYTQITWDMNFLDSPATTSAVTYKVQIYLENAGNIRHNSSDSNISPTTSLSSTTLIEIAG